MKDDFEVEPVPGLPEHPPGGERILWQGSPDWRIAARRILHVDKLAVYFALLLAWRAANAMQSGASLTDAMLSALWLVPLALVAIGVLCLIAWLIGRTTIYTITTARVALRFGVALPMTVNLPFKSIAVADVHKGAQGSGDLILTLNDTGRIGYAVLWPHARPWHFARPKPVLRCLPGVSHVGEILADALTASLATARGPVAASLAGTPDSDRPQRAIARGAALAAAE